MYSANIYNPSFIDEYSTLYPPINSVSHSAKSKGTRLHSANAQTRKIRKPSGCTQIFQLTNPSCWATISFKESVPVTISNAIRRSEEHTTELQSRENI